MLLLLSALVWPGVLEDTHAQEATKKPNVAAEPSGKNGAPLRVPYGRPIRLDGTLDREEWADALRVKLHPEREVWLKHDGKALHVGFRGANPPVLGSLGLRIGHEIRILHASASLGEAVYRKKGLNWRRVRSFTWRCQDTRDGACDESERKEHFEEFGWVASTMRMGSKQDTEYTISMPLVKKSDSRLSIVFLDLTAPGGPATLVWPRSLDDASRQMRLLCGKPAETLSFAPESWGEFRLAERQNP